MVFNSHVYLLLLIPAAAVYWLLPGQFRRAWLLTLSTGFYLSWQPRYVWLPFVAAGVVFWTIRQMEQRTHAAALWLQTALVVLLVPFCFFKYWRFALDNLSALLSSIGRHPLGTSLALALPLGISFYTFGAIAVLLDARQGRVKQPSFWDLSLLLSFWPYVISGPIVRFRETIPQLTIPRQFDPESFMGGLDRLLLGLIQKNVIANNLAIIVDEGFLPKAAMANFSIDNWMLAVAYGLQIYFDFAAYTNMAIGSARLLGITLPENFRYPYHAANPSDFWSRWHMSLSRWIRDYLFFPLNAKYRGARLPFLLSLVGIMALVGLWHGAGWGFIVWGAMHGGYMVLWRVWESVGEKRPSLISARWSRWGWRVFTLAAVVAAWVPFRAASVGQARQMLDSMLVQPTFGISYSINSFLTVLLIAGFCIAEPSLAAWIGRLDQFFSTKDWGSAAKWYVIRPFAYAIMLFAFLVFDDRDARFIYFQF